MNPSEPIAAEAHSNNKQTQDIEHQFTRLMRYLDSCRQQRVLVTYIETADAIEVAAPLRIHKAALLLEALMEYDYKNIATSTTSANILTAEQTLLTRH